MPHPIVTSVTLAAAVSNGIATAQSLPGASGLGLVLNGSKVVAGVAVLDAPRQVVIHSNGDDTGRTFTITGTRGSWWASQTISETITGANAGDAVSTQDFLTVTGITASGASAGTVFVGTSGTGSGPWVVWDAFPQIFNVSIAGYVMSGAPTWGVEYTYDDVFGLWLPSTVPFPRALPFGLMTGLTVNNDGKLESPVVASRLTLTAVGGVMLTQRQQGD